MCSGDTLFGPRAENTRPPISLEDTCPNTIWTCVREKCSGAHRDQERQGSNIFIKKKQKTNRNDTLSKTTAIFHDIMQCRTLTISQVV